MSKRGMFEDDFLINDLKNGMFRDDPLVKEALGWIEEPEVRTTPKRRNNESSGLFILLFVFILMVVSLVLVTTIGAFWTVALFGLVCLFPIIRASLN